MGVSVNEQPAEELHKPYLDNAKEEKFLRDLKTILEWQI